jgi:predicted secreted protein
MPVVAMGTNIKKTGGTAIANLTSIEGVSVSADTIESTALDTAGGYRVFVTSLKDAGEIALAGHFDYTSHNGIEADFEAGTSSSYVITFPDTHTWTFPAVVTAFKTTASMGDLVGFECTLKVSGKPTLA